MRLDLGTNIQRQEARGFCGSSGDWIYQYAYYIYGSAVRFWAVRTLLVERLRLQYRME